MKDRNAYLTEYTGLGFSSKVGKTLETQTVRDVKQCVKESAKKRCSGVLRLGKTQDSRHWVARQKIRMPRVVGGGEVGG